MSSASRGCCTSVSRSAGSTCRRASAHDGVCGKHRHGEEEVAVDDVVETLGSNEIRDSKGDPGLAFTLQSAYELLNSQDWKMLFRYSIASQKICIDISA